MAHRSMNMFMRCLALGALLMTAACTADKEEKLGYDGEFCAKDADCREGHNCERGMCVAPPTPQSDECEGLCDALTECGRREDDCVTRCIATLVGWSDVALASFAACTTDELTCEDAADGQAAANFCYRRVPLDPVRQARCDAFDAAARSFDPNNSKALDTLFDKCYRLARTGTEQNWSRTNNCQILLDTDGSSEEIKECLNQVFALEKENALLKVSGQMMSEPSDDQQ